MKRIFFALVLAFMLNSCGSAPVFDYDSEVNFTAYKTYAYYPDIQSGLSELDNKRVKSVLDSLIRSKNIRANQNPDLLVNFYASEQLLNANTIGVGVGSGGGNVGVGVSGGIPIGGKKVEQIFTLDFISKERDALVWQGVITVSFPDNISPRKKRFHYIKTLSKLLKGFPPKK